MAFCCVAVHLVLWCIKTLEERHGLQATCPPPTPPTHINSIPQTGAIDRHLEDRIKGNVQWVVGGFIWIAVHCT